MKLGVYIGSFNPVHNGHIEVVNYLLNNNIVDKVLIVPTGAYWDKNNLIDIKDRINMLRFFENERILIDDKHNDIPYTYLLMRELKKEYDDELYLILGADIISSLDKWKNYAEILKYKIIVMNRNNIDIKKEIEKYNTPNFIVINKFKYIDVSSTEIRNDLNNKYLDKRVKEYIIKRNLY